LEEKKISWFRRLITEREKKKKKKMRITTEKKNPPPSFPRRKSLCEADGKKEKKRQARLRQLVQDEKIFPLEKP